MAEPASNGGFLTLGPVVLPPHPDAPRGGNGGSKAASGFVTLFLVLLCLEWQRFEHACRPKGKTAERVLGLIFKI